MVQDEMDRAPCCRRSLDETGAARMFAGYAGLNSFGQPFSKHPVKVARIAAAVFVVAWLSAGCTAPSPATVISGPYEGTPLEGQSPDFQLLDQTGATVRLSDYRGKVVVLTFMDSQCREVCPLTAIHLQEAARDLGDQASMVGFLGINVNVEANRVSDVAETTQKWHLDEIPTWHFLTGSADELELVWKSYDIAVLPPPQSGGELSHTPGVFVIDPQGEKRWYISTPMDEAGNPLGMAPLSELLVKHIRELLPAR